MKNLINIKDVFKNIEKEWFIQTLDEIYIGILEIFYQNKKIIIKENKTLFGKEMIAEDLSEHYILSDYVLLKDFLNEFSGESEYKSSNSLYWKNHKDSIESFIEEIANEYTKETLLKLTKMNEEDLSCFMDENDTEIYEYIILQIKQLLMSFLEENLNKLFFIFLSENKIKYDFIKENSYIAEDPF